jgi:hypothetical protein
MLKVTVEFPKGFDSEREGLILLEMEQLLRESSDLDFRVFKARMGDDSKLRMALTPEERARV